MRIILLEDLKGLGKKYEIREVKDGHARNFLFPHRLAKPATPSAIKELNIIKVRLHKEDAELTAHLTVLAQGISGRRFEFPMKIGKSGEVFGSVTKETVQRAIREHGFVTKERVEVLLDHPLKYLGEYPLVVDFKNGVTAKIIAVLRPQL